MKERRPPEMPLVWWLSFVVTLGVCLWIGHDGNPAIAFVVGTATTAQRILHLIVAARWGRWR